MFIKFIKIFLIIILYQTPLYSKSKSLSEIDLKYISNYFSGIVAYENQNNSDALKFFRSSKFLINKHSVYLQKYAYSLVLESKVQIAINEIKMNFNEKKYHFFDGFILLALDSLKKNNFKKSRSYLFKAKNHINNDRINEALYETLDQYLYVFEKKTISRQKKNFGDFSFISETFQNCYLDDLNTESYFLRLINNFENEYSRYIFFYLNYLIEKKRFEDVKEYTKNLEYLNLTLLLGQGKQWVEQKEYKNFNKIFSCKNHNDLIAEFLFLVSTLYSSQDDYERSNYYLKISNFLNPKFKLNLSLEAENHYLNENYNSARKVLKKIDKKNQFYHWYQIKKNAQIISKEKNKEEALKFINYEFDNIEEPNINMIFDIANFNKKVKKYKKAITYYDQIIQKLNKDSVIYAEVLYRRGGCYERLKQYEKADKDLLNSLKINPDDAYVLNYLAYSWLERNYKIKEAIIMLENAYSMKSDDPYIIDSIGWAYYLIKDYLKAEKYMKRAVELMPEDPIVNDHYGDILWKLDRKIQARYFWNNVLKIKEIEDEMKKNIYIKLIDGIKNS